MTETTPDHIAHEEREEHNPAWAAINWNLGSKTDPVSVQIWQKLIENFWIPEKINLSSDVKTWNTLTDAEKLMTMRVFVGLTTLDTLQGRFGSVSLMKDARTLFEEAVLANITFMEQVHAKSYSSIFSTLCSTEEINAAFRWASENEQIQKKSAIVLRYYQSTDEGPKARLRRKAASTLLESFLFYSGFYLPLNFAGQAKLLGTADIVKLIIRDESVHGYFIGQKFQEEFALLNDEDKEEIQDWVYDLLTELYENEELYTQEVYDEVGWTEDVKVFLRYNANKALQNLGFDPLFPHEAPNPIVINLLSGGSATHDFFSLQGSSYTIAKTEALDEEEWDF